MSALNTREYLNIPFLVPICKHNRSVVVPVDGRWQRKALTTIQSYTNCMYSGNTATIVLQISTPCSLALNSKVSGEPATYVILVCSQFQISFHWNQEQQLPRTVEVRWHGRLIGWLCKRYIFIVNPLTSF